MNIKLPPMIFELKVQICFFNCCNTQDTHWNSEEFSRSFIRGSWDGFWWSFISMATVGYENLCVHDAVSLRSSRHWNVL